jgi:hypothetical protein
VRQPSPGVRDRARFRTNSAREAARTQPLEIAHASPESHARALARETTLRPGGGTRAEEARRHRAMAGDGLHGSRRQQETTGSLGARPPSEGGGETARETIVTALEILPAIPPTAIWLARLAWRQRGEGQQPGARRRRPRHPLRVLIRQVDDAAELLAAVRTFPARSRHLSDRRRARYAGAERRKLRCARRLRRCASAHFGARRPGALARRSRPQERSESQPDPGL